MDSDKRSTYRGNLRVHNDKRSVGRDRRWIDGDRVSIDRDRLWVDCDRPWIEREQVSRHRVRVLRHRPNPFTEVCVSRAVPDLVGLRRLLQIVTENPRLLDRELVTRCLAGEQNAERALYDAHVDRIYRLMYRMAGDGDLAADFTQETFIRAFERLEQFRGDSSLATWLHTIAVSVALNGLRKVKRIHGRLDNIEDAPAIAVEPTGFTADLKVRLHAAIDALSEKLRPVFVMHDVEGYTHEEIAGALGIPVGTSKARLFDARAKLRLALASFAGDHIA